MESKEGVIGTASISICTYLYVCICFGTMLWLKLLLLPLAGRSLSSSTPMPRVPVAVASPSPHRSSCMQCGAAAYSLPTWAAEQEQQLLPPGTRALRDTQTDRGSGQEPSRSLTAAAGWIEGLHGSYGVVWGGGRPGPTRSNSLPYLQAASMSLRKTLLAPACNTPCHYGHFSSLTCHPDLPTRWLFGCAIWRTAGRLHITSHLTIAN